MVSRENGTIALFVALGLLAYYGTAAITDDTALQMAVLFAVAIVVPTAINELRTREDGDP